MHHPTVVSSLWRHVLWTSLLTVQTRAFGVLPLPYSTTTAAATTRCATTIPSFSTTPTPTFTTRTGTSSSSSSSSSLHMSTPKQPFAVIVQAEIQPDRLDEFLSLIETNAIETRKEPGCLRFDVVQSRDAANTFFFYELYKTPDAIDYHKAQPHYALWATFKESGGVVVSTTFKSDGLFLS